MNVNILALDFSCALSEVCFGILEHMKSDNRPVRVFRFGSILPPVWCSQSDLVSGDWSRRYQRDVSAPGTHAEVRV